MCTRSLIRTASKYVSSEPLWHAAEEHLNQIDFTDLNYEDTDIMHKVIYPSEEFKYVIPSDGDTGELIWMQIGLGYCISVW